MSTYTFLKSGRSWIKFEKEDILFIESCHSFSKVITKDNQTIINVGIGKIIETIGSHDQFIRVHKRYILNVGHITEVTKSQILLGNHKIPIGKTYVDDAFRRLFILKDLGYTNDLKVISAVDRH